MRLGVLGPSGGDLVALAKAAQVLVDHGEVDRVIYLGKDDALDQVVAAWAQEMVGANPDESLVFDRATRACARATSDEIETFLTGERARRRLRIFTTVPPPPGRTIELLDGKIAVFVYDKASLDEDDIAGASLLVFGRSDRQIIHRVGSRTFVAPGPLLPSDAADGDTREPTGIAILDGEGGAGARIEVWSLAGELVKTEVVEGRPNPAKIRVQGSS